MNQMKQLNRTLQAEKKMTKRGSHKELQMP